MATKKGTATILFHPSSLLLFLDPRSDIRDPGWVKIKIREKPWTTAAIAVPPGGAGKAGRLLTAVSSVVKQTKTEQAKLRLTGSALRVRIDNEGPYELVQHFAYRESSHLRKGAARHITD